MHRMKLKRFAILLLLALSSAFHLNFSAFFDESSHYFIFCKLYLLPKKGRFPASLIPIPFQNFFTGFYKATVSSDNSRNEKNWP